MPCRWQHAVAIAILNVSLGEKVFRFSLASRHPRFLLLLLPRVVLLFVCIVGRGCYGGQR